MEAIGPPSTTRTRAALDFAGAGAIPPRGGVVYGGKMRLRLVHAAALAGSILLASCSERANEDRLLHLGDGDSGAGGHDPGTGGSGAANGSGGSGAGNGSGASTGAGAGSGASTGAGAGSGTGASSGTGAGAGTGAGGPGGNGAGAGNPGGDDYLVYASTDTALFALDPADPELALFKVGDFECIDPANGPHTSMLDIAVDRFQHLWGVTSHAVMPLLAANGKVHCGADVPLISENPGFDVPTFYALTFAPVGVLDLQKEVLVAGNSAGELWSIDAGGTTKKRGSFGVVPADDGHGHAYDPANVGKAWELSGDIVFLANEGKPVGFATVRDCPYPPSSSGCSKHDSLIEIDMEKLKVENAGVVTKSVRGKIVKKIGCGADGLVAGSFFGIAAWNDAVFGFSRGGGLVRVLTADAGGCLVKTYVDYKFSGAGVTTLAPIDVPPLQ